MLKECLDAAKKLNKTPPVTAPTLPVTTAKATPSPPTEVPEPKARVPTPMPTSVVMHNPVYRQLHFPPPVTPLPQTGAFTGPYNSRTSATYNPLYPTHLHYV